MNAAPLWTVGAMAAAMQRRKPRARCRQRLPGFSIDTRTHRAGRGLLRHQGRRPRRPRFRRGGAAGRRRARGGRSRAARQVRRATRRCSWCPTCSRACALSRVPRARAATAKVIARHRLGRQDRRPRRRCGCAARRPGRDPCLGRLLQQSLGRAAVAGALPGDARASRCFEIGMNHAGEIEPLTRLVRPHVAIITTVEPVHLEFFSAHRGDRRRQGRDLSGRRAGRRRGASIATTRNSPACSGAPRDAGVARIVSFGEHREGRRAAAQVRAAAGLARRCRRAFSAPTSPTSSARPAAMW